MPQFKLVCRAVLYVLNVKMLCMLEILDDLNRKSDSNIKGQKLSLTHQNSAETVLEWKKPECLELVRDTQ